MIITARHVEKARQAGETTLRLDAGDVLTPSARDRARELGVSIQGPAAAPARPAAPTAAGPATAAATRTGTATLTTQVPETRRQRSMLEFVAGLKSYNHYRDSLQTYMGREAAFEAEHGHRPRSAQEALALISDDPAWRTDQFVMNLSQDMLWKNVLAVLEPYRPELEARLTAAETQGPGRLELNPGLQLPAYYTAADFHIMPGSYHTDPIAGWVFTLGGSIYFANAYDDAAMQWAIVESLPDSVQPRRILDLGCSTGSSTFVWKQRFPDADVTGLDLAAPMLRFGHLRGVETGIDVTFTQRLAEDTGYPDDSFDLVTACILTHELPTAVVAQVFREAFRILRPGGVLLNGDINPSRTMPGNSSFGMLRHDFERWNNGEPYIPEILGQGMLPQLMEEAGFVNVTEPGKVHPRTGGTFPWITMGVKPA